MGLRNCRPGRSLALLVTVLVVLVAAVRALRRGVTGAADVPLSPLTGGRRVGADYPERRGIVADGAVAGEMDDLSAFARPEFDPDAVAPAVRHFYEHTADYELAYAVRWHRPFRLGAALASRATSRVEQLNLPGPGDAGVRKLHSRFARVAPNADPREGARAWVRTRADGTAVFVAIYAHHERDGRSYVNIAVPLPGGNLSTVLRSENLADGGLELTTFGDENECKGDKREGDANTSADEGLYLATPLVATELPLDQRFRVRPADAPDEPAGDFRELTEELGGGATVAATHEMWAFGRQFLTLRYAARPGNPP